MVESMDPRDDRTSAIRSRLIAILHQRMLSKDGPPGAPRRVSSNGSLNGRGPGPQLPPLTFDGVQNERPDRHLLTPITERSASVATHNRAPSIDAQSVLGRRPSLAQNLAQPSPLYEEPQPTRSPSPPLTTILTNRALSHSPVSASPASVRPPLPEKDNSYTRPSHDNNSGVNQSSPRPSGLSSPNVRSFSPSSDISRNQPLSPIPLVSNPSDQSGPPVNDAASVLTSPHSIAGRSVSAISVMTSPYSPTHDTPPQSMNNMLSSTPPALFNKAPSNSDDHGLQSEAGAMYYMQFDEPPPPPPPQPLQWQQQQRLTTASQASRSSRETLSTSPRGSNRSPPPRSSTMGGSSISSSIQGELLGPRPGLGRKPSGTRGPASHASDMPLLSSRQTTSTTDTDSYVSSNMAPDLETRLKEGSSPRVSVDDDSDALAALSYLNVDDQPQAPAPPAPGPPLTTVEPLRPRSAPRGQSLSPPPQPPQQEQYKSTFAPSKLAAERKAKAEAEKAAHHAAASRPGRAANGKRQMRSADKSKGWNDSSDEEDEEEEDEDEDDDDNESDAAKTRSAAASSRGGEMEAPSHLRPPRNLPLPPSASQGSMSRLPTTGPSALLCFHHNAFILTI